ncbi:MAG: transposase [Chloroflexi bacterium]|nr:transposase [Chloroflexota bacterium]
MFRYDPRKHRRRSIRLKGWDYRSPAFYFVTICAHQRQYLFDDPAFYNIAANALRRISEQPHAEHVRLDESIVMPNHGHILFEFVDWPGGVEPDWAPPDSLQNAPPGSLGAVVGQYKRGVTARINQLRGMVGTAVWQRGYYERIIRNERELSAIRQYIRDNPARWAEDRDNLDGLFCKMTYHP